MEIPLQPYDSCRLLHLNLYSFVDNPFTSKAEINWNKLESMTRLAMRMLDDIVDLELEKVDKIIEKIKSDPESDEVKRTELNLWNKIRETGVNGRRTGLGTTADGDMLAALGIKYGTKEGNECLEAVHKFIAVNSYIESIDLAVDRGSFEAAEYELEENDEFISKIMNGIKDIYGVDVYNEYLNKWKWSGRRNIACNTCAPTGCQDPNSEIITSEGIMTLKDIFRKLGYDTDDLINNNIGDMWFDDFESDIYIPNIKGDLNKITGLYWKGLSLGRRVIYNDGSESECSESHKFLVKIDKTHAAWKESKDLNPGDEIIIINK